jgi:SAM-dependent methyltransferase
MPWPDASFDAALAQLVIAFVADAPAAARELRRVVRPGGVVATCMWDEKIGLELGAPMAAARKAAAPDEPMPPSLRYRNEEDVRALFEGAGLHDVEHALLEVEAEYTGFDDFWDAAMGAVGPDTRWLSSLGEERAALAREAARAEIGKDGPFTLRGRAHAVRGTV